MRRGSDHKIVSILIACMAIVNAGIFASGARAATSNGGHPVTGAAGWKAQVSGTSQPLYSVSCFDRSRCKAVGAGGTMLYTKNGGLTWRPQSNPLAGTATSLSRIVCVPPQTCYVIGRPNIILVTHDGGVTWTRHRIALPGSTGQPTDSGCVTSQDADLRSRPALCRLGLLDLACVSASACAVVATVSMPTGRTILAPAVYATNNGGATWRPQQIPPTTHCTGACFRDTRFPYPLEWISCGTGTLCRAGGSVFLSPQTGFATLTIQTSKPGMPWTAINNSWYWPAPDFVRCTTASRCYGVSSTHPFDSGSGIEVSTDGGSQFNEQSSGSSRVRNAIACPGPTTCYSVGDGGTITASMNGSPFFAQRSATTRNLYGIACVIVATCIAVGNKGAIVARGMTGTRKRDRSAVRRSTNVCEYCPVNDATILPVSVWWSMPWKKVMRSAPDDGAGHLAYLMAKR